jgi:putative transposase
MIEPLHPTLSIRRQCQLLGLNRASFYREPAQESPFNLRLMRLIDEQYTKTPFYGYPKMTAHLRNLGYLVNEKRVARLMQRMDLQAVRPRLHTSRPNSDHRIYPYLLRTLEITQPNQVWCADITYVPMSLGFMYLVAIMDWCSRYVLAWQLSNTLDVGFCVHALEQALQLGQPTIFNTDQGAQFTARAFTATVEAAGIHVSMDGRGRVMDNIFIERLWRSVKYEDLYLKDYQTVAQLEAGLDAYFTFYNTARPHQSLAYQVPAVVHYQR